MDKKENNTPGQAIFWKDISRLGIGVMAVIAINILSANYFFRWDLTEENRYSLTNATKNLLRDLDEEIEIKVYLTGDLPAGFRRLEKSTREMLEEFKVYGGSNLRFTFVDPLTAVAKEERQDFFRQLAEKGIQQTNVYDTEEGKRIQKAVFPGAMLEYNDREKGIMLLTGDRTAGPEETLNQSIERIEYEFATAIRQLTITEKKRVGIIRGQGELPNVDIAGLTATLSEYYDVFDVNLPEKTSLEGYEAILVCKPTRPFSEQDKFKIDQFIMNGGKALFFIEKLKISMDSLGSGSGGTVALPYQLNLEDQLFRYGIRINNDFIKDIQCAEYPVVVGNVGNQPQIVPLPWPFFPLTNTYADHPIVKNLDASYLRFVSSMDTVKAEGILKTPLIYTSQYTSKVNNPVLVDIDELRSRPNPEAFRAGSFPVAYLLEGSFTSVYKNRLLPEGVASSGYREQGIPSKILVCSDGDFIRNETNPQNGNPYPLGYEPFSAKTYANKDFIVNLMAYMTDESGIINARAKEIKIRPLDPVKIENNRWLWQSINLILPLVLLSIYGLVRYFLRKRKYARKTTS